MKILFIVNGLGLGNSFRCERIIERLRNTLTNQKHEVHILTSGNGLLYFQDKTYISRVFSQNQMQYAKKLSLFQNLYSWFKQIPSFIQNVKIQKRLITKEQYDLIFCDSDYGFIFWKTRTQRVFGINNSSVVLSVKTHFLNLFSVQFLCEKIENFIFSKISTGVICPTFHILKRDSKTLHLPFCFKLQSPAPVARKSLQEIVILHGGSHFAQIDRILDVDHLNQKGIRLHLLGNPSLDAHFKFASSRLIFDHRKYEIIQNADLVIANAGFGSLVEILSLARAALVIPLPNHCEQWANAQIAQKVSNRIQVVEAKNLNMKIEELIESYPSRSLNTGEAVTGPLEQDIQKEFLNFFHHDFKLDPIEDERARAACENNYEIRSLRDLE